MVDEFTNYHVAAPGELPIARSCQRYGGPESTPCEDPVMSAITVYVHETDMVGYIVALCALHRQEWESSLDRVQHHAGYQPR